jgi:DNA-binding protein H-NS
MIEQLMMQRAEIDAAIDAERKALSAVAIAKVRDLVATHSLRIQDVFPGGSGMKSAAKKVPAKYRDPASGKTWSGRGISPKWFDKSRPQDFAL